MDSKCVADNLEVKVMSRQLDWVTKKHSNNKDMDIQRWNFFGDI